MPAPVPVREAILSSEVGVRLSAMPFDNDIFISYAHIDNEPQAPGAPGWVSEFHEALNKRLGEVLGKRPKIWRDPKLAGNDDFAKEIVDRFERAAVLVSVITPSYVASVWCKRELDEFWHAAERTGGPIIGNKARVFKVIKVPVDRALMPPPVEPLLGYEFFEIPEGGKAPLELGMVHGPESEQHLLVRVNDLAYDLAALLKQLEDPNRQPAGSRPSVYLATTTSDLRPQREALQRELLRQGYPVLPDRELPLEAVEIEKRVVEDLKSARLSIHLVGATLGVVPEGTEVSLPELQARLAAEQAKSGALVRLVWIAPDTSAVKPQQLAFIDGLRNNPAPGKGSDLLERPFEELKTQALARLQPPAPSAPPPPVAAPAAASRIYLVCDNRDLGDLAPLQDYLFGKGVEVTLPAFEGDEAALRQDHESQLRDCDALLIYYGAGGELWMRQKLGDIRRLAALGRAAPLRSAGVLIAPPSTEAKDRLRTLDATIFKMAGGAGPAAIDTFITTLTNPAAPK